MPRRIGELTGRWIAYGAGEGTERIPPAALESNPRGAVSHW